MNEPHSDTTLTYAQFAEFTEARDGRFEFVDGQAVAMGNPSDAHQDLALALATTLAPHLGRLGCKIRLAGSLRTGHNERIPDVLVICDGKPRRLVCEILSPNRGEDLGKKRLEYEAMPEFDEYLVIDSLARWVRVYRRTASGRFVYVFDGIAGSVDLDSIAYTLDIDALYGAAGIEAAV